MILRMLDDYEKLVEDLKQELMESKHEIEVLNGLHNIDEEIVKVWI